MTDLQIPEVFVSEIGRGTPLAYYPAKRGSRWGNLAAVIVLFAASGGALLWGAYHAYNRYLKFGPAIVVSSLTGPWILAAVLFFLALFFGWGAITNWRKAAVVYQNGMAYRDRGEVFFWRWADFQSMTSAVTRHYTNGIYTGTTHVYTLVNKSGEKILLKDAMDNVEDLAAMISKNIFPLLYEASAQNYNSGQDCDFGTVQLNKEKGLRIGKKQFQWDEIERVAIQKGVLSVKKKDGGWFSGASASASNIPNLEVMLSIIDQVVGLQTS